MPLKKLLATGMVVIICLLGVQAGRAIWGPAALSSLQANNLRSKGSLSAKYWITEFVDFQCGNCKEVARILDAYYSAHPQDIRLEIKYYPLRNHAHGYRSALYVECAARQGKFWEFEKKVFETQEMWSPRIEIETTFSDFAKELQLDTQRFSDCLVDEAVKESIQASRKEGEELKLRMTPTIFINGRMYAGRTPIEEALKAIFPETET